MINVHPGTNKKIAMYYLGKQTEMGFWVNEWIRMTGG